MIPVEDVTGLSEEEATSRLKALGFAAVCSGDTQTVTAQIPAPGTMIPLGSEVLLYLGESITREPVTVPDFRGLTRQQAADTAGKLGLRIEITGNTGLEHTVKVTAQSIEKNSQVPPGTTIQLEFTDTQARD
jgi:stage V sporulation protein D (sporulation-specific penicillin-binding protein)